MLTDEIKTIIQAKHESWTHAGKMYVSSVGEPCSRKLWYDFHDPIASEFSINGILAMADGNEGEEIMRRRLNLHSEIQVTDMQKRVKALGGRLSGKIDGIIIYKVTKMLWEHKNVNEKIYKRLKESVLDWEKKYYDQVQVYMHELGIDSCLFTVATPGGRDFKDLVVEYNKSYTEMLLERAEVIMESEQPLYKISDNPDFWLCRWCQYKDRCHG